MEIDEATGAAVIRVRSARYGGFKILVDAEDYERVFARNWCVTKGKYFHTSIVKDGKRSKLKLHRFIMGDPAGKKVDHCDPSNTFDNRKQNLRIATDSQNMCNRPGWSKKSKFKGLATSTNGRSWSARIMVNGESIGLGSHRDEEGSCPHLRRGCTPISWRICPDKFPWLLAKSIP